MSLTPVGDKSLTRCVSHMHVLAFLDKNVLEVNIQLWERAISASEYKNVLISCAATLPYLLRQGHRLILAPGLLANTCQLPITQ